MEVSSEKFAQLKAAGGLHSFQVVSGSMLPVIPIGAKVVVGVGEPIQQWDIVVFWSADHRLTCHVLWHINQTSLGGKKVFITHGLQGKWMDLAITEEHVLGKVINYRLGWWWRWRLMWRSRR